MSRSGYGDDYDVLSLGRWRGQVASATRGKRGQALFVSLAQALDEMPVKELIAHELKNADGRYCALGVLGEKRGLQMDKIDAYESDIVAKNFDIAEPLACEIVFMNDEYFDRSTPAERWTLMRKWVQEQIKP